MNPERQEIVESTVQRVIACLVGSWNFQLDDEMRKQLYDFVCRQGIDERVEVYFLKYIDKFDDMLYLETNNFQLRIVYMTRKRDGQKLIGINCTRTPRSKFESFCKGHGIIDELLDAILEEIDPKKTVLICVCKRREKFEKIKDSEGIPVVVTSDKDKKYSFYVLDNNVVIHLPTRSKSITWYSYEP